MYVDDNRGQFLAEFPSFLLYKVQLFLTNNEWKSCLGTLFAALWSNQGIYIAPTITTFTSVPYNPL